MSDDNPLKDRFDPIEPDQKEQSSSSESSQAEESESVDTVENMDKTDKKDEEGKTENKHESDESSRSDTRRDRPHTAMYISEGLVDQMKDRYRKINGELMINEGEEIELNKHFYEGLIRAGLENPDLREIVLAQRDEN